MGEFKYNPREWENLKVTRSGDTVVPIETKNVQEINVPHGVDVQKKAHEEITNRSEEYIKELPLKVQEIIRETRELQLKERELEDDINSINRDEHAGEIERRHRDILERELEEVEEKLNRKYRFFEKLAEEDAELYLKIVDYTSKQDQAENLFNPKNPREN